ncbi:winged helix-turn-helix transcriptional regulator [Mesorhizobium sp. NBSH29]|uniref:Lrp/AsnC family transcriptional regulator n=1 Tax=Mesorhizobium sp. NBSH29 TaxID=2654249 RepID=UPI0018963FD7|nr:Lrp/AsnC family transcriptional regulator [Mesorhizobium sp. NBSH29]QPC87199.1 winged helix-turn-helix transcriptional regulator [Mesorhizobium sp. NBSH29]
MVDISKTDAFDRALLALVQRDNLTPARVLAERVGLSESAVLRRLRRLRKDGIIIADQAVIDPALAGETLSIHVLVSLERERAFDLEAFVAKIRRRPEVRQAWYVTGEVDFILHLGLRNMEAYSAFADDIFHSDVNVKGFRTIVSIREIVARQPTAI